MEYIVKHYPEKYRFEVEENGMTAYAQYRLREDALDIIHTIVPIPMEGRGVAAALVEAAYKYAKEEGLRPLATCSYAVAWLKRHPDF
ncbi:GNAT family N-acetyltransferase [Parabacteroides sp.]